MTSVDYITDLFELKVSTKSNRRLKVGYVRRPPLYVKIPAIIMKGLWLEKAGFVLDTEVKVRIMEGCIVLTAKPPEPIVDAEFEEMVRKIAKLSAKKQKQVMGLVQVIEN